MSKDLFGEEQAEQQPATTETATMPKTKSKKPKGHAKGVVKTQISGEDYTVRMTENGISVRRRYGRNEDRKSIQRIIDFVTGQAQLPLESAPESKPNDCEDLINYAADFIACNIAASNDPQKFTKRLQFLASAFQEKLDEVAPGRVLERLAKITGK